MSSSPAQRLHSESHWRANRNPTVSPLGGYGLSQQSTGVGNKLGNFFDSGRSLPMYKDKPYFAPRRTAGRSRRRKILYGGLCVFVLVCLWYFTAGSSKRQRHGLDTPDTPKGEEMWKWLQSLGDPATGIEDGRHQNIDWNARREKVRDAFIISWDGYEQHGWGMFACNWFYGGTR